MAAINRRFLPISARDVHTVKRMDGETEIIPEIKGTAAVYFDDADRDGTQYQLWRDTFERIMPGAFENIADNDVRALQNHDPKMLLGRSTAGTLVLTPDVHGLDYVIDTADTTVGRDTVVSLDRGDMTGSSFAFFSLRAVWVEEESDDGIVWFRQIELVETVDVGPVTYPAYSGTTSGVRSCRSGITLIDQRSADAEIDDAKGDLQKWINERWHAPQREERERTLRLHELAAA